MKIKSLASTGAYLFVCCLVLFIFFVKATKPRILVLHSYSPEFLWTAEINTGIARVLKGKAYSIRYHYMDTKVHPDPAFKEKAGLAARQVIDQWKPDVVISVDDNAQEFAAKYYSNHSGIAIVFTGVNAGLAEYGYDRADNVTGVLERIPAASIVEGLRSVLYPGRTRIHHISDASETSLFVEQEMHGYDWSPFVVTESRLCETFPEWQAAVAQANASADILMTTHYHTLRRSAGEQTIVPPREVIRWTMQNTKIPVFSMWGFFVEDGGGLAFAVSSYEMGEEAARMAAAIAEKRQRPGDIPVAVGRQLLICAREKELQRFDLHLPVIYEAFARATGSYYP